MPTLIDRFNALGCADPPATVVVGCRADYLALKPHHYRPGNPATMSRVFVVRDQRATASDRFLERDANARPIAVLVESYPVLSCQLRDEALGGRYGHLPPKPRARLLMQELRCISRVIVDPRYRGMGLAVLLVRYALATATTRYTEALAVMGRVSPFFGRGGMLAYERPPHAVEQRALAALRYVRIDPLMLAMPARVEALIRALADDEREWITRELSRWYRTAGGRGIKRQPALSDILRAAHQRLLAQPIYYLHENTHAPASASASAHPADPDRPA